MPRPRGSGAIQPSRRRKKKKTPVGLIVGLSFGGVAILGAIVAIVVSSIGDNAATPQVDSETPTSEAETGPLDLTKALPIQAEPQPFHDEGLHKVGPLAREEIRLSNARFVGFATTQTGFPFATWRVDYEFINGGFQPAQLRDAYELRIRGGRLDEAKLPQERAWTIRHPVNQAIYSEQEAGAQMLELKGTVEVTWVIPKADFAPPYTFWVYRKDPQTEELFLRVSKYTAASGDARP